MMLMSMTVTIITIIIIIIITTIIIMTVVTRIDVLLLFFRQWNDVKCGIPVVALIGRKLRRVVSIEPLPSYEGHNFGRITH